MTDANRPSALISYSHDSPEHEHRVLDLCNRLRARGVDALVDQFLPGAPSEGWPLWMERQIEGRDFTLMVCTESYRRRFMEDEASGVGRGVVWEARILRNLLYEDSQWQGRIVPLLFASAARQFVPTVFRGNFYDVSEDNGFESLLRHLLREPGSGAESLGSLGPQGSRWSAFENPWLVPDAMRTRYFTGREQLLAQLHRQLTNHRRAALSGLGGVGKTQTAIEYAVRHRAEYPDGVFWTNAESTSGLTSGFVEIAKTLRLGAAASSDQEQVVRATLEWMNGNGRWLLILDNVEDRRDLQSFVPQRGEGHILITSREPVFQELGIARALEAVDLEGDDAVRFLLTRTGRDESERSAAADLADELGNLPLALEQAAAYIAETGASFADYLTSFRKRHVALLEKAGGLVSRDTVAVTWAANFEAVERASPAAADALRISAFLAPDAIPFEVFAKGAPALGGAIADTFSDPEDALAMSELMRPLARYSLVRADMRSHTFGVHRLVQETVRAAIRESERPAFVERAVRALDAVFPEVSYTTWAQCDRLVSHVATIADWIDAYDVHSESAGRITNQTGQALFGRGRCAGALRLLNHAVKIRERALGPDHADVGVSLNNVANVYNYLGRYADALPVSERALALAERGRGGNHAEVADSLNGLALSYAGLGRYSEAQPLFERALGIEELESGTDHPAVAKLLNNLANLHLDQDNFAEAMALHRRALAINESAFGPDHPSVAKSLNNIVRVLRNQGMLAEAQPLSIRALAIAEHALGPDHPDVAFGLNHLANILFQLGRPAEAEPLFERALSIRERNIDPEHTLMALSLLGLASVYQVRGRIAEAVPLVERAIAIRERKFAANLPTAEAMRTTLDSLHAALEAGPNS
jgi:tetratricopeptide (TPR) repeat protein